MIEAALAVDRLFWPPKGMAGVPISEVSQIVQNLHDAVLALARVRGVSVSDG